MSDINYDACAANLLEMLDESWNNDVCVCEDFGAWESLTADTLSPSETRRLAEYAKDCPDCRQRCADAFELRMFEESPLYERMRAYRENPDSETDENWKTLAFMFDKTLARVGTPTGGETGTDGRSTPRTRKGDAKTGSAWGRFFQSKRASLGVACSAAAALAVVAVLTWTPNDSDVPHIANNTRPQIDEDPGMMTLRDLVDRLDASNNSDDDGSKSIGLGGGGAKSMRAPMFDLCNLNVVASQYSSAVDSFNNGDYAAAAENFGKLVNELKKNKSVDAETIDAAYWNWGVATLNCGEKKKAAKIFRDLKKRDISVEMREMTEAALAECQN